MDMQYPTLVMFRIIVLLKYLGKKEVVYGFPHWEHIYRINIYVSGKKGFLAMTKSGGTATDSAAMEIVSTIVKALYMANGSHFMQIWEKALFNYRVFEYEKYAAV